MICKMTTANDITETMLAMGDERQRDVLMRFFKTGKGQYGEGDRFIGLRVPQTRAVVKEADGDISLSEIKRLIYSPWHEIRLCGFLLIVDMMKKALPTRHRGDSAGKAEERERLAQFYLKHARQANNWDLVDLSCEYVIGYWLLHPAPDGTMPSRKILDRLAHSDNLWEQRIAIVSTLTLIRERQFDDTLRIASLLLDHPHDLIHKAVGWALREVGKRDIETLRYYLSENSNRMARTTLRYAIERMDENERREWMKK